MYQRISALFLAALFAVCLLAGCGAEAASAPEAAASSAGPATDQVAAASEMTTVEDVVEEGMEPVYADALKEGVYPVEMKSSSSMFKADHVELKVEDGRMQALLYMTSQSYLYMFAGTAAEAAAAAEADYIPLTPGDGDMEVFALPVEALDAGLSFAAFSKKKEKWYDRTLLFRVDSLPAEAFLESPLTTVSDLSLEDGTYTVEVTLSGGSGKASVESPAVLTVRDGEATAAIVWSSSNYGFMMVGDEKFLPVNETGNSAFEIPVAGFDSPLPVQADTTAMSQPYLIDYTLLFDSATIEKAP